MRRELAGALLVGSVLLGSLGLPKAASADSYVAEFGGLDLYRYCRSVGGVRIGHYGNAYSWYCEDANGRRGTFTEYWLNRVCTWQYWSESWAFTPNPSDPYSLKCYGWQADA